MSVSRLDLIPGCTIDHVAAAAGWSGPVADRHVRIAFTREPVERVALVGDGARAALASLA